MLNYYFDILNEYDALIFDFDAALIDREPYNKLAHCSDKDYERYSGKVDVEILKSLKKISINMLREVEKQA